MPMYQVTLELDEVEAMLTRAPHQVVMSLLHSMAQVGPGYLEAAQHYPPELGNQRYRRTGRLGMSWTFTARRTAEGVIGELSSRPASGLGRPWYARWVMDRNFQAQIHRGRWQTVQGIAEERAGGTRAVFIENLRRDVR